ncbi:SDR family NAD(P)-dependent oxidoreductase [Streptomyces sp. NPDC091209]|uniref:SDR family NAD(P)-dependent oxidoreductase n=1 Tax=Streptomyces sp. NPDC091209 TaxID=3365974 RepID=UPI0038036CA7
MRRLDGKVALISGTADGQGRAAALRFAAEGALVVGGDLLHEQALDTQRLIAREGGTAPTPGPLDVTNEQSVSSWVHEAVDAFGGIDIVYAGADRFGPVDSRLCKDFAFTMRAELDPVPLAVARAAPPAVRLTALALAEPDAGRAHAETLTHLCGLSQSQLDYLFDRFIRTKVLEAWQCDGDAGEIHWRPRVTE